MAPKIDIQFIYKKNKYILYLLILFSSNYFSQNKTLAEKKHKYWALERNYTYEVTYVDSLDKLLSYETLTLQPTEKVWERDSKQTLVIFLSNYSSSDSALLFQKAQNGLKRSWMHKYEEGVIENENRIWIHPLRQNQYVLTEIAPFPEVKLPLEVNRSWQSMLQIYEGFGSFQGDVKSNYIIESREARHYKFGTLACWKINSEGEHTKLGKNGAVFYFNKEVGFTEMNYWFYNGYKISLKLIDFR
mgnify:CR=1 FL=1